jgi:hypothetical protein
MYDWFLMNQPKYFFYFDLFFKKNREMNPTETYFQVLLFTSRATLVGVIYKGVVLYALLRLMGQARAVDVAPCRPKLCHTV